MKPVRVISVLAVCAVISGILLVSPRKVAADDPDKLNLYNPYPPGILPSDLESEILRIRREVQTIEKEAIQQWKALPPPTLTGQPPTLQNTGTASIEILGKLMQFDENISVNKNQACDSCHMPYAGYSGPIQSVNLTMIAYPGSSHYRTGKRTPQRYPYAPFFPVFQYDGTQGLFFGGNFWDSRSTGYLVRNPDSEQAQHPPVDSQEMGMPDTACITFRLSQAAYRPLFEQVFGAGSFNIDWPANTGAICSTPGGAAVFGTDTTPVKLKPEDRTRSNRVYDEWGAANDAYEQSLSVSAFTSKFDAFLKGNYTLTPDEMAGYNLFRGKGNCNSCHLDGRSTAPSPTAPNAVDTGTAANVRPVFTCFGSANEGLPLNPRDTFYYQTTPDQFRFTANPYGFGYRDLGLGTFLRSGFGSAPSPNSDWTQFAPTTDGTFQVSTARNAAMTPPQCPTTEAGKGQPYFQKGFFHNGYIKSLKQLVHFYNTRDVYPFAVTSGNCPAGKTEKVDCWPMPEVKNNLDMTTGKLGLTDTEENQIVAFLQTLTDGFVTPYPDRDKFTGTCSFCDPTTDPNCSPSMQGYASLIPTPTLPACASAVCGVPPVPNPPIP